MKTNPDQSKCRRSLRPALGCGLWLLALGAHGQVTIGAPPPAVPGETCQLSLSEPDIDYGGLTRGRMQEHGAQAYSLGKRRLMLNVNCRTPVRIGIRLQAPAAGQDYAFGSLGRVGVRLERAQLDGHSVMVGTADTPGTLPAAYGPSAPLTPGRVVVPVQGGGLVTGSRFSANIEVDPFLPQDAARVRNRTPFETNGTFEVIWE
ncbi:DUF1120 domain-containing protein [Cupriavidus agavae]|uniref:DUF1120 domain-containing protein n=1 Tax=Cupriavidus agavae TaxID=1001822 RepID=A0A4Q7RRG9_9BURK|nr:hypothetical protein [Cupriavidus agavae]RZT36315.1 hypothetical protein EV147_3634 [Cupriavidus agavae]